MMEFDRQDSRKRRRLSERRRVFSRIGLNNSNRQLADAKAGSLSSSDKSWSSSSQQQQQQFNINNNHQTMEPNNNNNNSTSSMVRQQSNSSRSDSPLIGEGGKISMKIQFHITVAPEHEPLILDTSSLIGQNSGGISHHLNSRKKSTESIGDQIHERLQRQNTLSTRRRQQLLAMHNRMALAVDGDGHRGRANSARDDLPACNLLADDSAHRTTSSGALATATSTQDTTCGGGRESGARSSTITGGMADEATVRFLQQQQQQQQQIKNNNIAQKPLIKSSAAAAAASGGRHEQREHIYFKRDGQRFGHEFTLKLAVDRTYRCLLKVRPLIPLQSISIQGHHVLFADCSQSSSGAAAAAAAASAGQATSNSITPSSAPASSSVLNRSWQDIRSNSSHHQRNPSTSNYHFNHTNNHHNHNHNHHHHYHYHHRLNHAQTTSNLSRSSQQHQTTFNKLGFLYQQQQNQMMRYFAASHCSSSSNSHLGSQLIYMFDWSASRFEVNKNKNRTQIQTVLKFKNGQILSLPLQVKFYQSDCKQHLSWGSQLHFIDYDCNINNLGQISVERVQYY